MSALGYQGLGFLAVQCFQPPLFVFMVPLGLLWANCDTFADTLILNQISCSCQELELCLRIEVSAKVREFSIYLPCTILCSREPHILSSRYLSDMPNIIYTHAGIIDSQRLYVNA